MLAPLETARKYNDTPIKILASEQASDTLRFAERERLTEIKATRIAGEKAYKQAKVSAKDINLAEVHDCFTIAEIMAMEDLGSTRRERRRRRSRTGRQHSTASFR